MSDIVVAIVVLLILSCGSFALALALARRSSPRLVDSSGAAVLVGLLLFVATLHGTWQIARILPFSNAIILGNWIPLGGAFLAGLVFGQNCGSPAWRRGMISLLLILVSAYSVGCCFLGHLPSYYQDESLGGADFQRLDSTCGPCSVATLLRHHGIDASPEEMRSLCLTSHRGSPALGLYRGLKLKTRDTRWDVEVVRCSAGELLQIHGSPLLLRVRALDTKTYPPVRTRRWQPRSEHAVLFCGVTAGGRARMIDPAVLEDPYSYWLPEVLDERWCGEALRLVPRDDRRPAFAANGGGSLR